jgi:hypothetical protein
MLPSEEDDTVINAASPTELDPRIYRAGAFRSIALRFDEAELDRQRLKFYRSEMEHADAERRRRNEA